MTFRKVKLGTITCMTAPPLLLSLHPYSDRVFIHKSSLFVSTNLSVSIVAIILFYVFNL